MTVKRGASIVVPRKIVKIGWDNVFGELLTAVDLDLHSEVVRRVSISKNEKFIDPVHQVDVSAPLTVCSIFGCKFVCVHLEEPSYAGTTASK